MKEKGMSLSKHILFLLLYNFKSDFSFKYLDAFTHYHGNMFHFNRILALRKAEKEEERRAREKIRQKLEEDKVQMVLLLILCSVVNLSAQFLGKVFPGTQCLCLPVEMLSCF